MTGFEVGQKYRVTGEPRFHYGTPRGVKNGDVVTVRQNGVDWDGDVAVYGPDDDVAWVRPHLLTLVDESVEEPEQELDEAPELELPALDPRRVDAVREAASVLRSDALPLRPAVTPEAIISLAAFLLGELTPQEVYE